MEILTIINSIIIVFAIVHGTFLRRLKFSFQRQEDYDGNKLIGFDLTKWKYPPTSWKAQYGNTGKTIFQYYWKSFKK